MEEEGGVKPVPVFADYPRYRDAMDFGT